MLKKLKTLLDNEIDPAFSGRAEFIFEKLEKDRPSRVLDIGCGRGFYVKAMSIYPFPAEIVGIDTNKEYLTQASKGFSDRRVKLVNASAYELPFKNNYFDFIICSEVLEHLDNEKKALSEMFRVLKKGGKMAITVPSEDFPLFWDPINWVLMRFFNTHVNSDIWFLAGIWAGHLRLYKEKQLVKKIKQSGFRVLETASIISFSWPFSHFLLYGIGKNIVEVFGVSSFSRFDFKRSLPKIVFSKIFSLPTKIKLKNSSVDTMLLAQKS